MNNDSPFNLFKQSPKKSPAAAKPSPQPPSPKPSVVEQNPQPSPNDEFKDVVAKVTEMHDELQKKLDETYQNAGWSIQEIKSYLENPNNFDSSEWERIQRERAHLTNQIWAVVGEEAKRRLASQQKKKDAQASRGKNIGARKKNWIQVR